MDNQNDNLLERLQKVMVDNCLRICTIPKKVREVYEVYHKDAYPGGHIEFLEGYNREMWVREREPQHAGQFIVTSEPNISSIVTFREKKFYGSLEEIIAEYEK